MNNECKKLLTAIMTHAIKDLRKKKYKASAVRWFKSRAYYIGSFVFICQALKFCPDRAMNRVFLKKGIK